MKASVIQTLLALYLLSFATCFTTVSPTVGRLNTVGALSMAKGAEKESRVKKMLSKVSGGKVGSKKGKGSAVSKKAQKKAESNSKKYQKIDDIEERAFQVLLDLGLVDKTN